MSHKATVSAIVPVSALQLQDIAWSSSSAQRWSQAYNEERCIAAAVQYLKSLRPALHEVLVVDGGSTDRCVCVSHPESCLHID